MKNTRFGRETNSLLFYKKIKIFSIPVKSNHREKLPEKWPENYWLKNIFGVLFEMHQIFGQTLR